MSIAVESFGSGKDIVLVHGWGLHSELWKDIAIKLSTSFRVTLIDLPGHGNSRPLTSAFTLNSVVDELTMTIPNQSILLGWSLGGMISTQLAIRYPEKISQLILVCSTPQFAQGEDWPHAMSLDVLDSFSTQLEKDYHTTLQQFLGLQVMGTSDERGILRELRIRLKSKPAPGLTALRSGLNILKNENLRPALHNLDCPMLLIYGQLDRLTPAAVSKDMKKLLPTAECCTINGAGHAPFISHPNEFFNIVTTFIENQ
ncbi:MAG: pimeloyl-ACP methyl ester esterase BioH [Gammaproteobacteria bacterium]